jgi:hypothetical protein
MTTRVHVVNLGPDVVIVKTVNPATNGTLNIADAVLYPGDSFNQYVYDNQAVQVVEKPKQ